MTKLILTERIEELTDKLTTTEVNKLWNVVEEIEKRIDEENKPVYLLIEVAQEGNSLYEPHVLGTLYSHRIFPTREEAEQFAANYQDSVFWSMFVIEVPNRKQAEKMLEANKDRKSPLREA